MSRGHGRLQRLILRHLEDEATRDEELPPLSWYTARAMGLGHEPAASSAFRRAASRLADEGLLEVDYVWVEGADSPSAYYRADRRAREDRESPQGPRIYQVVRLAPSDEAIEDYVSVERSFRERVRRRDSSSDSSWMRWYFHRPEGVFAADAPESTFKWAEMEAGVSGAYLSKWTRLAHVPSSERLAAALGEGLQPPAPSRNLTDDDLEELSRLIAE